MARGGARNRSGPPIDPDSGRSDARGIVLTALPNEGYRGEAPKFPLPEPEDGLLAVRELEVWDEAWTTPQAAAWSVQMWRLPVIAEFARLKAQCEMKPNASLIAQLHRYRDQIGLTPAGLKENGWAIAVDEVAAQSRRPVADDEDDEDEAPRRLSAVNGDQ